MNQSAIDKKIFDKETHLIGIRVNNSDLSKFVKLMSKYIFRAGKKLKNVVDDEAHPTSKLVLLSNTITREDLSDLPSDGKQIIEQHFANCAIEKYTCILGYDQLPTDEVLKKLLPPNVEIPSAYEQIGHIAHMNLRDIHEPYKHMIGQVILEKSPSIETVVNKVGSIETKFREFKMEVLAGKDDFNVELKEHGLRFRFNYSEVYWNSRLQTEHQRLLKFFTKNDLVCDMFAGVGPFAVPAAKNVLCQVYANDLNPKSYQYLQVNSKLNKVDKLIHCYNMDGREFVKHLVASNIAFSHVIMNLPASAVEFLDVFRHLFPSSFANLPMIHCYTFVKGAEDPIAQAKLNVEQVLFEGEEPTVERKVEYIDVFDVRDVAPKKNMICVSFKLPASIAYVNNDSQASKRKCEEEAEGMPLEKKQKK